MCNSASLVLTRNECYHDPDGDSHESIIALHRLHADGVRGPNIVPVEVVPPGNDYSLPIDQWQYRTDCDLLPDWYAADPAAAEARARAGLVAWAADHVYRNGVLSVCEGQTRIALNNATIQSVTGGIARAYGNAKILHDMRIKP